MIVRLGTAPRIPALDFEQFQEHWRTSHADVVAGLPGLRRYQQFHAVLQDGEPLLAYPGFDACSALRFDGVQEMDDAFASDVFRSAVTADEAEFVDKTHFRGLVGRWQGDTDADLGEAGPVQVLTFLVAEPGAGAQQLADRLSGTADPAATLAAGTIVADAAAHAGRFPAMADAVRVTAHADVGAALRAAEQTRRAAAPAQVVGEHVARIVDVPPGTPHGRPSEERKD